MIDNPPSLQTIKDRAALAYMNLNSVCRLALSVKENYYSSSTPCDVADMVQYVCDTLKKEIISAVNNIENDPEDSESIKIIIHADKASRSLPIYLEYVAGGVSTSIPGSLSDTLDRLAKNVVSDARILLSQQWIWNYGIVPEDLKSQLFRYVAGSINEESEKEIEKICPGKIYAVFLPVIERETALMHALIGHEIGHLLAKTYIEEKQVIHHFED
jgi:hypothetical protein